MDAGKDGVGYGGKRLPSARPHGPTYWMVASFVGGEADDEDDADALNDLKQARTLRSGGNRLSCPGYGPPPVAAFLPPSLVPKGFSRPVRGGACAPETPWRPWAAKKFRTI
ncbi:hypothetical protein GCM10010232_08020 [Streptomyces amakusaensis]